MTDPPSPDDRLRFVLLFVALFGAILFLVRPEPARAQTAFRSR